MPPRRRSKKASQKESDERLSVAETIAGLANSIEQPAFSSVGVTTRQNSYQVTKLPANLSELPSMVADEVDGSISALPPVSLNSLPSLPASVDDIAVQGQKAAPTRKLRSRRRVSVQNQSSVCSPSSDNSQSHLSSTVTVPGTSHNVTTMQTGHLHDADTVSAVSVSLNTDSVFSAVLMGWNPPVLASCPPTPSLESVTLHDVCTPLAALKTVEPTNNYSSVEVLKLPFVLEPISDGTWQLVPMSASAPLAASVLPSSECVIQAVAQQSEHFRQSVDSFSSNVAQAASAGGNTLLTAVDGSQFQLPSLGSLNALGNYYNRCSTSTVVARQQFPGGSIATAVSCNGPSVASEASSQCSSSEDVVSGTSSTSVLGSLSALRDYYKCISNTREQTSTSLTATTDVLTLASASGGNNDLSYTEALLSKISASVCNDQIVQPVSCTDSVCVSAASHVIAHTVLSEKLQSACTETQVKLSLSRVLPAVSVDDDHQTSFDSANKQLVAVLDQDRLTAAADEDSKQHPCEELRHLPLKKRQKVSNRTEMNGYQHELEEELAVDNDKNADTDDAADILLSEEIASRQQSLSVPVSSTYTTSLETGSHIQNNQSMQLLTHPIFCPDEDGDLPLHVAVVQSNLSVVQQILRTYVELSAPVNYYNNLRQTPLHLAVLMGQTEVVACLLEAGASPNCADRKGLNSLHLAVVSNYTECLRALLMLARHPVDLDAMNYEGLTPLHLAVKLNRYMLVEMLISSGADVNVADGKSGHTALHLAAEAGRLDIVGLLLARRADVHLPSYYGCTAMQAASARAHNKIVKLLVEHGADNAVMENRLKHEINDSHDVKVRARRASKNSRTARASLVTDS